MLSARTGIGNHDEPPSAPHSELPEPSPALLRGHRRGPDDHDGGRPVPAHRGVGAQPDRRAARRGADRVAADRARAGGRGGRGGRADRAGPAARGRGRGDGRTRDPATGSTRWRSRRRPATSSSSSRTWGASGPAACRPWPGRRAGWSTRASSRRASHRGDAVARAVRDRISKLTGADVVVEQGGDRLASTSAGPPPTCPTTAQPPSRGPTTASGRSRRRPSAARSPSGCCSPTRTRPILRPPRRCSPPAPSSASSFSPSSSPSRCRAACSPRSSACSSPPSGSGAATSRSTVPAEGNDEFAALGKEFNSMARQLEGRLRSSSASARGCRRRSGASASRSRPASTASACWRSSCRRPSTASAPRPAAPRCATPRTA